MVHGWEVDGAQQPLVHRHVPQLPVVAYGGGVPPVLVEFPVTKTGQLQQHVRRSSQG